ncbi:MAG: DUF2800 domain-containing protein [Selenomonas sp.]|uniref:DUF2800 domain-containing protein n=1 Tax=Selenomonas sp. TaxID=2053611 RepID=UPI0025FBE2A6|nr:DUF2800 domain-containing protein [Selenomonas sp.]MCI6087147.1 DUF2800 domain-containing protein [Selenomonas sp.]MDY4417464.1 DUF2800 domain-containing protein [Selenomonas sp.]
MARKHASLSPSASARWIACPPSARLAESYENKTSSYAEEGTSAHALCAYKLEHALGRRARDPTEDLTFYDEEMETCAEDYAAYVLQLVEEEKATCRDPLVLVEERLDYSRACGVPDSFGTGDCVLVADGRLTIVDFKYGKGIPVDATRNTQLMCYALGALDAFDGIYAIDTVRLVIYQPRLENIITDELSKDELTKWGAEVLMPCAKQAYAGEGEFQAGDHCRFCPAKADCRKRAEYNLELAKYDFAMPDTLADDEIAALLPRIDDFIAWANDIKAFALQKALDGYKIVAGRSVRKYTDEAAVAKAVQDAGFDPYEKRLLGITAMGKLLGKKRMEDLLGGLLIKPPGKPTLVPDSDKRRAIYVAAEDFKC